MANHGISWVPGAHMHFGSLNFVITMEGELAQAPTITWLLHSTSLDAIDKAFEELRLHAPEACAPESDQLLNFDYGRLER